MAHPEDKVDIGRFVLQQEMILRESMRMAERVISEAAGKHTWESIEAKEKYFSAVPYIAQDVKALLGQLMGLIETQNAKQLDRIYDNCQEVLDEVKRRNDAAEKG